MEEKQDLFAIHSDTDTTCPVGAKIGCVLENIIGNIQSRFEEELETLHLSNILEGLGNREQ